MLGLSGKMKRQDGPDRLDDAIPQTNDALATKARRLRIISAVP